MRQIVLDTETTGINIQSGNRIVEIGCVEMINRKLTGNVFHQYVNPQRDSEEGALNVHGITTEFLQDKPLFEQIGADFFTFVEGAELVIHNAPFDMGFLNHELKRMGFHAQPLEKYCTVLDTLKLAKQKHPGAKNNLDALCRRYFIDNSSRTYHGALLDAEILAEVYLAMTGGQSSMNLGEEREGNSANDRNEFPVNSLNQVFMKASEIELKAHDEYLDFLEKKSGKVFDRSLW